MKIQKPKQLKPNPSEFHQCTNGKISAEGRNSAAWKVVNSLFHTAQKLYNTLDFHTCERLSVFVDHGTYLTPLQEHDLASLTAQYIANLDILTARDIVTNDPTVTDAERQVLLSAIDLFKATTTATCTAFGNPRWVE